MGQKILSYSTAIAISLLLLLPAGFTVHAQQRPYVNPTPKEIRKKRKGRAEGDCSVIQRYLYWCGFIWHRK